jgi:branched-chain amino acid transport system substrate-binding protein
MKDTRRWRPRFGAVAASSLPLLLVACSSTKSAAPPTTGAGTGTSPSSAAQTSSLPSTIKIYATEDLTGPAAFAGNPTANGLKLAVSQINSSGMLGASKIDLTIADSKTSPTVGASLADGTIGQGYAAVIGDISSSVAVAQAPIFARNSQATVFTQAGSAGVLVGPTIFRMTPLQTDIYTPVLSYLQKTGIKTIALVYNSDFPTIVQIAQLIQQQAATYGLKVVGTTTTLTTQTDISGAISKLQGFGAQADGILLTGPPNASAVTQLSQNGSKALLFGQEGAIASLAAAGNAANGFVMDSDWSYPGTTTASSTFDSAYQAAYGIQPVPFSAEGYDAMTFIAQALKAAGSTSSSKVAAAMRQVGSQGFSGLLSNKITIKAGQEQSPGLLVQWENGAFHILSSP